MRKQYLLALPYVHFLIGGTLLCEAMILSSKGSDKVTHRRLYLETEDVGLIKKTRAAYLKESATKFNLRVGLEGNGMDGMVVAALFAENPLAQDDGERPMSSVFSETFLRMGCVNAGTRKTLRRSPRASLSR